MSSKLNDVDLLTSLAVQNFAGILSMSVEDVLQENAITGQSVNFLRSLVKS
jgi:hypothetical protein